MDYFVGILLVWLLCLLSVLLHELGHALGYRISAGKAEWKVIAGSGPGIFSGSRCEFRLIPAGGYFIPGKEPETNKAKIAMLAGGPVVSLLLAVLFGVLHFSIPGFIRPDSGLCEILLQLTSFLLYFNFFQFFFTAVPIRYRIVCRGSESDGLQIVHVLRHNDFPDADPEKRAAADYSPDSQGADE